MNEQMTRRRTFRTIATAMVAAAAIAIPLIAAPAASASQYGNQFGRPGAVYTGTVLANGSKTPLTTFGTGVWASLRVPALTIYRSPGAAGTQVAGYQYHVKRWDGARWVTHSTSQLHTVQIGANQSGVTVDPGYRMATTLTGHYYIEVGVTWATPNGISLGGIRLFFNQARDYSCFSFGTGRDSGSCAVYNAGYVLLV